MLQAVMLDEHCLLLGCLGLSLFTYHSAIFTHRKVLCAQKFMQHMVKIQSNYSAQHVTLHVYQHNDVIISASYFWSGLIVSFPCLLMSWELHFLGWHFSSPVSPDSLWAQGPFVIRSEWTPFFTVESSLRVSSSEIIATLKSLCSNLESWM